MVDSHIDLIESKCDEIVYDCNQFNDRLTDKLESLMLTKISFMNEVYSENLKIKNERL